VNDLVSDFDAILAAMNSYDGGNLQAGSLSSNSLTVRDKLGLSGGGLVYRGKSIINTTESLTPGSLLQTMATPDQVLNVRLETDGLIFILVHMLVKFSDYELPGGKYGAVYPYFGDFIWSRQESDFASYSGLRGGTAAKINTYTGSGVPDVYVPVVSFPNGLMGMQAETVNHPDPVTTGMAQGIALKADGSGQGGSHIAGGKNLSGMHFFGGGPLVVWANAGTYPVRLLYACPNGGTITAKQRKMWVWTVNF